LIFSSAPIEPRFIFLDLYTYDITSDGLALARLSDMTAIAAEPPTAASDSQTIDLRKGFGASVTRRLSTVLGLGGASVDSPSTTSTDTLSPASSQATNGSANKREIEMAETRIKKSDSSRMKQRRQTGSTALLAEVRFLSSSFIVSSHFDSRMRYSDGALVTLCHRAATLSRPQQLDCGRSSVLHQRTVQRRPARAGIAAKRPESRLCSMF
jgi:hypothetical protein